MSKNGKMQAGNGGMQCRWSVSYLPPRFGTSFVNGSRSVPAVRRQATGEQKLYNEDAG
jgi:hypothetical protein